MTTHNIRYLIDVDGFHITEKPYLVKEIGIFNFHSNRSFLYRFRLHRSFKSLSRKDQQTVMYCYKHIHGFKFKCYKNDLPKKAVSYIIDRLASQCNRQGWLIGHKGGHLLIQARVEHIVNIKIFGTPKFKDIYKPPTHHDLVSTFQKTVFKSREHKCNRHHPNTPIPLSSHRSVLLCFMDDE
ncbi:hypothetical protein PGB90_008626 [Kerria lacca]